MLQRRAGDGIRPHSHDAADQDVSGKSSRSSTGNLSMDINILALIPFLFEGDRELILPADRDCAGCRAALPH